MKGLSQIFSVLLATSTNNKESSVSPSIASSSPSSFTDLSSKFTGIYKELQGAPIYKEVSPTIKFSFVAPATDIDAHEVAAATNNDKPIFDAVTNAYGNEKPIAVYLPGLDCAGISASQQFADLSETFELWRMTVTTTDRTSFRDLSKNAVKFIEDLSLNGKREVTLIGESFGGQLAPVVALQLQARKNMKLKGLVMVNPATSFDDTNWGTLGPLLAALRVFQSPDQGGATPYTVAGGLALSALIPDSTQLQSIIELITGVPVEPSSSSVTDLLEAMDKGFGILGQRLPADLINHRVGQWLPVGAQLLTKERLASLQVPTLIVAGEDDKFLPSKKEAARLTKLIPGSKKLLVKGSGHFVLDNRVNLTEAIIYSDFDPLHLADSAKKYDPILDWKLPEEKDLRATIDNRVQPLRRFTSPVFMSTDDKGKRWKGLGKLPNTDGPIVFVANHQIFGLDLGMIIAQLIEDRGIVARGLAHPVVFQNTTTLPGQPDSPGIVKKEVAGSPADPSTFTKFGAVKVSPRNYYRLLQTGQNALLFPGGVREVFHGKNEAYQLFWPETPDFVRTAARFNATIIPISAVGSADSVNILIDAPDMAKLPFGIGKGIVERSSNTTSARFNQDNDAELFVPPFFVPKFPPARHYFVFGKPLSTANVDCRDLSQCETFYKDVKVELERGFEDVLRSREKDPYKDNVERLAYEQVTGKPAPTFAIDEMNKNK